ncbi:DNA-binding protein [Salegentibacter sp. JZCK2]|uniref:DNA-binding protein n=1 Tax=Salegentibacter tibetensis TaxID=2873600 RepID=UPI001CCD55BD|nr:DNA-binding protein [Salegentibacter tibetensis]MBZ9729943.1 DNA-binding protein [Salegentibacter tibetensis]
MEKGFSRPLRQSLHSLEVKIDELIRATKVQPLTHTEYLLLDNADFIQLFKITARTAQHWREDGVIEFLQIKGKIYYKIGDVKAFIDRHRQARKQR